VIRTNILTLAHSLVPSRLRPLPPRCLPDHCTYPLSFVERFALQLAMPLVWVALFACEVVLLNVVAYWRRRRAAGRAHPLASVQPATSALPSSAVSTSASRWSSPADPGNSDTPTALTRLSPAIDPGTSSSSSSFSFAPAPSFPFFRASLPPPASFGDLFLHGLSLDHFLFGLTALATSFYFPVASALLRVFSHRTIGEYSFLAGDLSVQVAPDQDPRYTRLSAFAQAYGLLWVLGVPALMLALLAIMRRVELRRRLRNGGIVNHVPAPPRLRPSFWLLPLCSNARPAVFWWDIQSMGRRVALMGVLVLLDSTPLVASFATVLLCVAFLLAHVWVQPYTSRLSNLSATCTLAVVTALAQCMLGAKRAELEASGRSMQAPLMSAMIVDGTLLVVGLAAIIALELRPFARWVRRVAMSFWKAARARCCTQGCSHRRRRRRRASHNHVEGKELLEK